MMTEIKENKKTKPSEYRNLAVILMLVFFAVITYLLVSRYTGSSEIINADKPITSVYFNEIMTNNTSYPNRQGMLCDWVELCNSSHKDADISGYIIYDGIKEKQLTLPEGTIIKANGFLLVSFGGEGDFSAPFALSKNGGETLILCSNLDVIIDNVVIGQLQHDYVMTRTKSGNWKISSHPTPLFENDYEKYTAFMSATESSESRLIITEAVTGGEQPDWVEITNTGIEPVDLTGYFLSDDTADPYKGPLPGKILAPDECIVISADGKESGPDNASVSFKISSDGETLYLFSWRGILCDSVDIPDIPANYSYARTESGEFYATAKRTPGLNNNHVFDSAKEFDDLLINEVCPNNVSGIRDADDSWSDWIEITNQGNEALRLEDVWISADSDNMYEYKLPDITLESKQSIVVFADNKISLADEVHTGFNLSSYGEKITLCTNDGYIIDTFEYSNAQDDMTYTRQEKGGTVRLADFITPGCENTLDGYIQYMSGIAHKQTLLISEVMTSNSKYLPQEYGETYDWIELMNNSDLPINLNGYSISDDADLPDLCPLPNAVLQPRERFVIICSGDSSETDKQAFHADFQLSAKYSPLYLFDADGKIADWMTLYNIPPDTSYGTISGQPGYYFFVRPTPGQANQDGVYGVSKAPTVSKKGGAYQTDGAPINIELLGEGDIYYTLDGTLPSIYSSKYTHPIDVSDTSVIRAIAIQPAMLASTVTTAGYFLNTNHELPILSLAVNPKDMFNHYTGIYVKGASEIGNYYKDWEKQANLSFYDTNGKSFSIDCGLKMHGGGSRRSDEKKSLKVIFRPKYGQGTLEYDLFGEDTPDEFASLVIRAGEDYRYTVFRSELITGLAKDADPAALTQDHKYCVLYVNGEYFGIFALMERYNEEYYAARYNVTPESVEIVGTFHLEQSQFYDLIKYCSMHNMEQDEHYNYIADRVDIDNLIDWCIFQSYSGNTDIAYNTRLIRSTEGDQKWRYCFYDLDWTMRNAQPSFAPIFNSGNIIYALPRYLIKNQQFLQKFKERSQELALGVLSDENVLKKIDEYDALLRSELPADRKKWHCSMSLYESRLETLKSMIADTDRWGSLMPSLDKYSTP